MKTTWPASHRISPSLHPWFYNNRCFVHGPGDLCSCPYALKYTTRNIHSVSHVFSCSWCTCNSVPPTNCVCVASSLLLPSMLGLCLAWACEGLRMLSQLLWVHMCTFPAVSGRYTFLVESSTIYGSYNLSDPSSSVIPGSFRAEYLAVLFFVCWTVMRPYVNHHVLNKYVQ